MVDCCVSSVPLVRYQQVGDPAIVLVGRRRLRPFDEVAIEIDVVLVHPPHPREAVRVERMEQHHAHVVGPIEDVAV